MQVKTLALATTSLVALGLAVAPAAQAAGPAPMMGRVDIDFSHYWDDFGSEGSSFEDEYVTWQGIGRVNIPVDELHIFQVDIWGGYSLDDGDGRDQFGNAGAGVHFGHRDPEFYLGVFGALGRANSLGDWSGINQVAGFEGQWLCERFTIYPQIGYWDSHFGDGLLGNAGFARLELRFYPQDRTKITGAVKYIDGEVGNGSSSEVDSDGWDGVVRVDHMMGRGWVAVFAEVGFRSSETHWSWGDEELDVTRANVGFTFYLGGPDTPSLIYHDRNGVALSSPDPDELRVPYSD